MDIKPNLCVTFDESTRLTVRSKIIMDLIRYFITKRA